LSAGLLSADDPVVDDGYSGEYGAAPADVGARLGGPDVSGSGRTVGGSNPDVVPGMIVVPGSPGSVGKVVVPGDPGRPGRSLSLVSRAGIVDWTCEDAPVAGAVGVADDDTGAAGAGVPETGAVAVWSAVDGMVRDGGIAREGDSETDAACEGGPDRGVVGCTAEGVRSSAGEIEPGRAAEGARPNLATDGPWLIPCAEDPCPNAVSAAPPANAKASVEKRERAFSPFLMSSRTTHHSARTGRAAAIAREGLAVRDLS
jgi:hypothetical protein